MARRRKDAIIAPLFPIFTPSFPRKRESRGLGTAFVYPRLPLNFGLLHPRELMSVRPSFTPKTQSETCHCKPLMGEGYGALTLG